jgi:Ca2+-binding EF-hand superfamily protein
MNDSLRTSLLKSAYDNETSCIKSSFDISDFIGTTENLKNLNRSSIVQLQSRNSKTGNKQQINKNNTQHIEIQKIAKDIFNEWDVDNEGIVSEDQIKLFGLNSEFSIAFARVLGNANAGRIRCKDVANCLTILKFGSMSEKVSLLVKFMDKNGNKSIAYEEAQLYLKVAPRELFEKLGFIDALGKSKALSYDDILKLFEKNERGADAINVFCQRILNILQKQRRFKVRKSIYKIAQTAYGLNTKKIFNFFLFSSSATYFTILIIFLQISLWIYNFHYFSSHGYPICFAIAKGFGLNLRILTIFLYLTMCRTTMGYLSNFKLLKIFVPLGFNIQIHSFCGFSLLFHAIGHLTGHIFYHVYYVDGGFKKSFQQKSLLLGTSSFSFSNNKINEQNSGDGITGFILLFSILIMSATALTRGLSSNCYTIFSCTHFLYLFFLPFLFLHVPRLWPFFISISTLFCCERLYDFFQHTTFSTLLHSRPCNKNVVFLSIPRTNTTSFSFPGCYYRIKIPKISVLEWHPFSLAGSVSSHQLTFFIANVGDWTNKLMKIVQDSELRSNTFVMVFFKFKKKKFFFFFL